MAAADSDPVRVVFVCWGNICRSPIAERVARRVADDEGRTGIAFTSAATSSEELGAPMDPRAAAVLRRAGYDADGHLAHQIDAAELQGADLVIAMEDMHITRLHRLDRDATNIHLLSDFDPQAAPGSGLADPWYGPDSAFDETLAAVEAAVPGVLARAEELRVERERGRRGGARLAT